MITQAFSLPRVRTLERKLEAKMIKEERDYHDLESVVQQVEQNLELMTVSSQGPCSRGEVGGPAWPDVVKRQVPLPGGPRPGP